MVGRRTKAVYTCLLGEYQLEMWVSVNWKFLFASNSNCHICTFALTFTRTAFMFIFEISVFTRWKLGDSLNCKRTEQIMFLFICSVNPECYVFTRLLGGHQLKLRVSIMTGSFHTFIRWTPNCGWALIGNVGYCQLDLWHRYFAFICTYQHCYFASTFTFIFVTFARSSPFYNFHSLCST